jgi:ATP-dependent Clp protease ATP-binding subunit ClpA
MRELERRFPPEFLNRIDEVVLFAPLNRDEVREIALHYLEEVKLTLARAGKAIDISDDALELMVTQGYSMAFGARFLKRAIDERIKLPISERWKEGNLFEVRVADGEVVVRPSSKLMSAGEVIAYGDVA